MREATPKELKSVNDYIKSISYNPIVKELEEIKAEIGKRKAESKQLSRNDYEMGLSDGRTTEKMAIIQILDNHIKELNNEKEN